MPTDDPLQDTRPAALTSYRVLDAGPEAAFDDLASLAAAFCEAPIALISLVGQDRQWFQARIGLEAYQTSLGQSVCRHALRAPGLLVIPDLTRDPRTANDALVTAPPHIRFCAGAPLITAKGETLGTLCVIDTVARPAGLTARQALALEQLARQVMTLLEIRTALVDRRQDTAGAPHASALSLARARSNEIAQEAGRIGTFSLDIGTGNMEVSPGFCRIFGLPTAPFYPAALLESLVVVEDRGICSNDDTRHDGSAPTDAEYRIRRANDGALRWVGRRSDFTRDAAGQPVTLSGTVQDITDQKLASQRLAALMELGEVLRQASSEADILSGALSILGRTLNASRVGYASIEPRGNGSIIAPDWTEPGTGSIAGPIPLAAFSATLAQMRAGTVQAIDDVECEPGLEADRRGYRTLGVRAVINVPQVSRGELTGVLLVHAAAPRAWSKEEARFVRGVSDRVDSALARLRAEAAQSVLNRELSHRLKNTLAMVQAITSQTLRRVTPREPVQALEQRLLALSAAHEVLLKYNWTRAPLRQVVARVMQPFGQDERVRTSGPDVLLAQRSALSLSMLLHELGTNAVKYGALSTEAGQVRLTWDVVEENGVATLVLRWRETGGPPVVAPSKTGFGSALIGMGLGGTGEVDLRYSCSGVEFDLRAPLTELQED